VSVFDSSVQGGDAVWEGLRVYQGRIFRLQDHLNRLHGSARAMAFAEIPSQEEIKAAIFETLAANGMRDGAHIRLTLTRGEKVTSGMDPRLNQSGPVLIVLAEWKAPVYDAAGIVLITSSVRRNSPQCLDSHIHHNNLINNILAKIDANVAGADDAVMLDVNGFVAETNATNLFAVRRGVLCTPHADHCLPGVTRSVVLEIVQEQQIPHAECRLTLTDLHTADELFTTGTMGELTAVLKLDGRTIGTGEKGPMTVRLQELYAEKTAREGDPLPS
jgi:branched-chain amino acid aminotransferase group I